MPFQPILDRWRTAARTVDANDADAALAKFASRHPQVLTNLDSDREISQPERERLLEQVILVDVVDAGLVEATIIRYCRAHQCSGRKNATAQRAVLGHVEERSKIQGTLVSTAIARSPVGRRCRSSPRFNLDSLLLKDLAGQKSLLDGKLLSRWIMWSFYQPHQLNAPFHGLGKLRSELIRRLGLGRTDPNEELLLWEHCLEPHQTAHRPTAFDAEAYNFFRPGGKTHPLSGSGGLHEVVHPKVAGNQLAARIEVAS